MGSASVLEKQGVWRVVAVCVAAFVVSASLRLVEVVRWDPQIHRVDGEYLLATHDAYAWAAGAENEDYRTSSHAMARILQTLAGISSSSPANLAFWLPAILSALSAIPIALWCLQLGARNSLALSAGVFGSTAPAFFSRTRVGYFDTDWATLFFPIVISLLLAVWIERFCVDRCRRREPSLTAYWIFKSPFLLLLVIPYGSLWHDFVPTFALIGLWITLLLLLMLGMRPLKLEAPLELLAVTVSLVAGWIGSALGIFLLLVSSNGVLRSSNKRGVTLLSLMLVMVLLAMFTWFQFEDYLAGKIMQYFQPAAGEVVGISYPELGQSVREVQKIDWVQVLGGAAFQWWIGIPALVGYIFMLYRYPLAVFLAPLLSLGLLSPRLGTRFTMYAVPALMIGLFTAIDTVLRKIEVKRPAYERWFNQLSFIVLAGLVFVIQGVYARFPIETVLSKEHAAGLKELRSRAEEDAMLWIWWDYGYAAQYYAGLPTFADGGRNNGEYLFTLGYVLGSDKLEPSAEMMRYAASQEYRPWEAWNDRDPEVFSRWLDGEEFRAGLDPTTGEQYIAVQWDAVALVQWIQSYGSWDFKEQSTEPADPVFQLQPLELDLENGVFTARSGRVFQLESADILTRMGSDHYEYAKPEDGLHLLLHADNAEVFLLGDDHYESTLVQLLLGNSSSEFELVLEHTPELAVYRLK
jgi:dolichyl-diphosphooligosaccharide--protein glycosyltransferase